MQKWRYLFELIHDLFFNEIYPAIQFTSLPPVGRSCYYNPLVISFVRLIKYEIYLYIQLSNVH